MILEFHKIKLVKERLTLFRKWPGVEFSWIQYPLLGERL